MVQRVTKFNVTMSDEKWEFEMNPDPRQLVKIVLLKPQIIGNWGLNAGDTAEVSAQHAKQYVANGVARIVKDEPEPPPKPEKPKKQRGWPKGKPRKPKL